MPIIKCKMCGGDVVLTEDKTVGICEYCGSTMTFPRNSDEQRTAAFNRGNAFRRAGEFDKALAVYERIVAEDDNDAEAHWCCALCRFGIEWVEDPNTFEYVPTCHRASFDSFLEDVDYKAALEHSDGVTRRQYQKDGARINEVQRGILATSQHEKPFDVFICYKELDDDGNRTRDSIDAQEIYYNLTQEGYRVFFSRITLEDKVGTEYEPYIFAALNSAKVMVVLGSKPEYFNAVWVKNEWSRYLTLMHKDRSKLLLPCYKNMDPYDLPDQLSVLMSYDMTKIGFMQDLLRGIRKVLKKDEPKTAIKETVVVQQSGGPNVDSLLQRAFIFLEDGDWQSADEYCERVLDQAPKTALAYLGKLMVELRVSHREDLREQEEPFDDRANCQRAIRYGDEAMRDELEGYNAAIRARIEEKRKAAAYAEADRAAQRAGTEAEWLAAAKLFDTLAGYRDAGQRAETCREQAAELKRKAEEERRRQEEKSRRTQEEKKRHQTEKAEAEKATRAETPPVVIQPKKRTAKMIVAIAAVLLIGAGLLIWKLPAIRQAQDYKQAIALAESGDYDAAIAAFTALGDYKDSEEQATAAKFNKALGLLDSGDYEAAYALLQEIGNSEAIASSKYERALGLLDSGDYEAAYALLEELGDSETIASSKYERALGLLDSGDYEAAYALLEELGDSEAIASNKYDRAVVLIDSGDYEAAYALLNSLDYKDSASKRQMIEESDAWIRICPVGGIITFGSYEQDNDTANGKEDIEWIVLEKEDNRILVISKYALDCQKYNTSRTSVTWETCSLRKWLNGTFLNAAFSSEEQSSIVSSNVTADKNPSYSTSPGDNTTDKVFLLSITEVNKYFSSGITRQCQGTAYCYAQGAIKNGDGYCWFRWLRSPGGSSHSAANVHSDGSVYDIGRVVDHDCGAVRPALWIDLG